MTCAGRVECRHDPTGTHSNRPALQLTRVPRFRDDAMYHRDLLNRILMRVYRRTAETGRSEYFTGDGLHPEQVDLLSELLDEHLGSGERVDILAGYWMGVREEDGVLHADLGHRIAPGFPLASFTLTAPPAPVMKVSIAPLLTAIESSDSGGAAAALLRVSGGMGDLERCLGWAWLRRYEAAGGAAD